MDSGTSALPKSMLAAQGQRLGWKDQAKCRSATGVPLQAWKIDRKDRGDNLAGRPAQAWISLALAICETCPVQWDCTRFALAVGERWHTWGVDIDDLRWLKDRDDAVTIIEWAERQGVSVQVAVRRVQDST